jgi:hypothetical protein
MFSSAFASWFSFQSLGQPLGSAFVKHGRRLKSAWRSLFNRRSLSLAKAYLTPTAIAKNRALIAILVACAALIGLVVAGIWVVSAFLHLLVALFAIYLILTKVFEIRLDVGAYGPR